MKKLNHRIALFIAIVVGCGWFGKIIDLILVEQLKGQSLGSLIWLVVPCITAIVLAVAHKSEYKTLGLKPKLKGNAKWYFLSLIIFPGIAILTISIAMFTNAIDFTHFEIQGFVTTIVIWFIYNFFRTILEEIAWRGFLQERLIFLKVNDGIVYFIVSMVWTLWHIPYYLFFNEGNGLELIVSSFVLLFSWSILYAEIYRITRTIWPCVLLHATSNAIQYTMLEHYIVMNDTMNIIISPTISIVACSISIMLGLTVRKYRLSRNVV